MFQIYMPRNIVYSKQPNKLHASLHYRIMYLEIYSIQLKYKNQLNSYNYVIIIEYHYGLFHVSPLLFYVSFIFRICLFNWVEMTKDDIDNYVVILS